MTRTFITEHKSPPLVPIHSAPSRPTSSRLILILSSHLALFSESGLFQLGFSTKAVFFVIWSWVHTYRTGQLCGLVLWCVRPLQTAKLNTQVQKRRARKYKLTLVPCMRGMSRCRVARENDECQVPPCVSVITFSSECVVRLVEMSCIY